MVQMQMEPNDYNSQLDQGACDMLSYLILCKIGGYKLLF